MKSYDQRSPASKVYRFCMQPWVRNVAVASLLFGSALVIKADNGERFGDPVTALLGGALLFMGMFAGIARWVAEPAAHKILMEHTRMGASSHPELVSRSEWDHKHLELTARIVEVNTNLVALTTRLNDVCKALK